MTTDTKTPTTLVIAQRAEPERPTVPRPALAAEVVERINETHALLKDALTEGIDYGVIPGTKGRVLLKPGAEKISIAFGCHPEYEIVEREVDHDIVKRYKSGWIEAQKPKSRDDEAAMKESGRGRNRKVDGEWQWQEKGDGEEVAIGLYRFMFRCRMVDRAGSVVGEGLGSCSSLESKYRSRPHEVENTVLKMAQKRARIAATLDAFGLSDAFTQDLEDFGGIEEPREKPVKQAETKTPTETVPGPRKPTADQAKEIRSLLLKLGVTDKPAEYLASLAEDPEDYPTIVEALRHRAAKTPAKDAPKETARPATTDDETKGTAVDPEMITDEQKTKLLNLLDKGGATTAEKRLAVVGGALGVTLQAIGALTRVQASEAIRLLSGPPKEG